MNLIRCDVESCITEVATDPTYGGMDLPVGWRLEMVITEMPPGHPLGGQLAAEKHHICHRHPQPLKFKTATPDPRAPARPASWVPEVLAGGKGEPDPEAG